MAREVRVPAAPDFPVTIFIEIQTSVMSTGRTLFSHTPRTISKKSPLHHISYLHGHTDEKFLRSFFQKATVSPARKTRTPLIGDILQNKPPNFRKLLRKEGAKEWKKT